MGFLSQRFPDGISRGARGGPRRRTTIVTLHSGREERNASWAASRREYDVAFAVRANETLHRVIQFFEAANGQLHGFRFKDWSDYRSGSPIQPVSATDQEIGTGDGTQREFQLRKAYSAGSEIFWRTITRPVIGTVSVAIDGVVQPSGWSVDLQTGLVTFDAPPAFGDTISAGFEFDVPARFDTDVIQTVLDIERTGSIDSIPIIEIRE
ncbi:MAG: DUF2460 domain-containing protein [bacterium]|nr:DUF2460 domain-containing protein [bacterium]